MDKFLRFCVYLKIGNINHCYESWSSDRKHVKFREVISTKGREKKLLLITCCLISKLIDFLLPHNTVSLKWPSYEYWNSAVSVLSMEICAILFGYIIKAACGCFKLPMSFSFAHLYRSKQFIDRFECGKEKRPLRSNSLRSTERKSFCLLL